MSLLFALFTMGPVCVAFGCAAVFLERLSGLKPGWSSFAAGVANASAFITLGELWDGISVAGLVTLAALTQFGVVAWRQRLRESHIYRDKTATAEGVPGSLDPTATTRDFG